MEHNVLKTKSAKKKWKGILQRRSGREDCKEGEVEEESEEEEEDSNEEEEEEQEEETEQEEEDEEEQEQEQEEQEEQEEQDVEEEEEEEETKSTFVTMEKLFAIRWHDHFRSRNVTLCKSPPGITNSSGRSLACVVSGANRSIQVTCLLI